MKTKNNSKNELYEWKNDREERYDVENNIFDEDEKVFELIFH